MLLPANRTTATMFHWSDSDKKVETAQSSETTIADRSAEPGQLRKHKMKISQQTRGGQWASISGQENHHHKNTSDDQGNWYYTKDGKSHHWFNNRRSWIPFPRRWKQVKGQFVEVNGKNYYLDDHTGMSLVNYYLIKTVNIIKLMRMGLWQRELNCLQTLLVDIFKANDKGNILYHFIS